MSSEESKMMLWLELHDVFKNKQIYVNDHVSFLFVEALNYIKHALEPGALDVHIPNYSAKVRIRKFERMFQGMERSKLLKKLERVIEVLESLRSHDSRTCVNISDEKYREIEVFFKKLAEHDFFEHQSEVVMK